MLKRNRVQVILAAYLLDSDDEDDSQLNVVELPRKRRTCWRKQWLGHREAEGYCAKLLIELRAEPQLYRNFVRMSATQFDQLLALVTPYIEKADTNMRPSIPASVRLVLTLRFLASGDSFRSLQYLFRIPHNTISTIIPEVLDAIYKVLVDDYLKMPTTAVGWEAWEAISQFNDLWQFPNCIGAVDGKHVVMVAPPNAGSVFYNYKGTHSIILMGIADANYKLIYVDVGRNGRFSDGGVFHRCTFSQAMNSHQLSLPPPKALPGREIPLPYVIVADDAFALRPNILKPYSQRGLTMVQRIFNYRLSRARRIIENVFGIMSARFRVLRKPINLDAEKTKKVALACCVLHNYLLTTNKATYAPAHSFDRYDSNGNLVEAEWRENTIGATLHPLQSIAARTEATVDAKKVQQDFGHYFVEEGEVEWQYKHI